MMLLETDAAFAATYGARDGALDNVVAARTAVSDDPSDRNLFALDACYADLAAAQAAHIAVAEGSTTHRTSTKA